jgi:hypothetical protein
LALRRTYVLWISRLSSAALCSASIGTRNRLE